VDGGGRWVVQRRVAKWKNNEGVKLDEGTKEKNSTASHDV
jgi:hypothetical protein